MSAHVVVEGKRVALDAKRTIGSGGEATVFQVTCDKRSVALKRYHAPSEARAAKLSALVALAARLPASVVAPTALAYDEAGERVVGFTMPLLGDGHEPISQLCRKSFLDARGLHRRALLRLLVSLGEELDRIHAAGVVVGDLNDQNELFAQDLSVRFIDVDSFQLPGFACEVATEAFLDPWLYGPDAKAPVLTGGGRSRTFTTESDWYAFSVLVFRALVGAHPYGGVRDDLPSLPERARAGASVLGEGVTLPSAAREGLSLLTRDLRAAFTETFEQRARARFPLGLLEACAAEIVRCSCGLELPASRLPCPRCTRRVADSPRSTGGARVSASELFAARGPIVALATAGERTLAVALEAGAPVLYVLDRGELRRELLFSAGHAEGFAVSLSSERVAVAPLGASEGIHVAVASGARVPFVTERAFGRPTFAAGVHALYRVARGTVLASRLEGDAIVETPVTSVIAEQTHLTVSADVLLASSRFFSDRRVVAIARGRRYDLSLAPLEPGEALVEEALAASETSFAVLRVTMLGGRRLVRAATFDRTGEPRSSSLREAATRIADDAIASGLCSGDVHLVATDRGLVREDLSRTRADALFPATAPYVGRDALLASHGRGLVVAHDRHVTLLRLDS